MELKITKQVEEVINVEFPLYAKTIVHNFYFKSENECMLITSGSTECSIQHMNFFSEEWMLNEPSTKAEFDDAFNEAITKLQENNN